MGAGTQVDGVHGLLAFLPDGTMETRNRRGIRRDWLRGDTFEAGLRRLPSGCRGTPEERDARYQAWEHEASAAVDAAADAQHGRYHAIISDQFSRKQTISARLGPAPEIRDKL